MNNKIIDFNTFQVLDDNSGYVIVDDSIANTICLLNKKGYKTLFSCGGHPYNPDYMKQVCDISLLDKQKIENEFPCSYIVDVNEKDFTLISPKQITTIYIMFDKDYKFKTIPKGFGLEPNWDENEMTWSKTEFNTIRFNINYFKDNVLRKLKDVLDEINEYNKILYKWAEELPYINERNDENE